MIAAASVLASFAQEVQSAEISSLTYRYRIERSSSGDIGTYPAKFTRDGRDVSVDPEVLPKLKALTFTFYRITSSGPTAGGER